MKLHTNFNDFYDKHFDILLPEEESKGQLIFQRFTSKKRSRRSDLNFIQRFGWNTPPHGRIEDLCESIPVEELVYGDEIDVIVYLDESSHNGEKKIKMNLFEATEMFPDNFGMLYIEPEEENTSIKMYRVGKEQLFVKFKSRDSWMSNVGETSYEIYCEEIEIGQIPLVLEEPIYSIDMIKSKGGTWYATDYNEGFVLSGSPVEKVFSSEEVAKYIEQFILEQDLVYNKKR